MRRHIPQGPWASLLFGILLTALPPYRLSAVQCPDGSPPPCRAVAAAPTRRPAPPLDERTWIVLPFENVSQATDVDWLRNASVNLLYLDMSRWRDVRVIDDERVADLMRAVPAGGALGLQTGLTVARRAGAGRLVMGDLIKTGSRTALVAKVFNVRTGQRVRSVREETAHPDSLMGVFSRLAKGILDVPPPPGTTPSATGTTSLQAYQEYVAGVEALNSWDLDSARARFSRALAADTTFALAHYKLSMVEGWFRANSEPHLAHARAAARLGTSLPPRERALIAGQLAQTERRWSEACDIYHRLIRGDSSDVEAWYNLGECTFHDDGLVPLARDTSRRAFRGDWNTSLRAFVRALELDPTYHLAFRHIQDMLRQEDRGACAAVVDGRCAEFYRSYVLRDGDTLRLTPIRMGPAAMPAMMAQQREAMLTNARYRNLLRARDVAASWVANGPNEPAAHLAYGDALLATGDLAGAARELNLVRPAVLNATDRAELESDLLELAVKQHRLDDARRLADSSFVADSARAGGRGAFQVRAVTATFGWFRRFASSFIAPSGGRDTGAYGRAHVLVAAGVPPPDLLEIERRVIAADSGRSRFPGNRLAATLLFGLRYHPAGTVPAIDTVQRDPRAQLVAVLVRGDTARSRAALRAFDSTLRAVPAQVAEKGAFLLSADAHLMFGDSAAALEQLLEFERRWPYQPILDGDYPGFLFSSHLWGRTWMLLGDLALARGQRDAAARGYRRVVGLWSRADPELQPTVERARAALANLESR